MEDNEEEEDDDDNYPMFAEYGDTAKGDCFPSKGNEDNEAEDQEASDEPADDLGRANADARREYETEKERLHFDQMLEDHNKLLYPTCEDGQKKLGSTLELLQWKAENGLTDSGFEKLLKITKKQLPRGNELPTSTYEAKKVVCPLGLDVQNIHACINDCILYHGEYENLDACPVCTALRYKIRRDDPGDVEGKRPRKRVPAKVMWYAPIIPRLKRLFRNKEHARLLRRHKEDCKKYEMLRHPADGSQWRKIDREVPYFAEDARNLRPFARREAKTTPPGCRTAALADAVAVRHRLRRHRAPSPPPPPAARRSDAAASANSPAHAVRVRRRRRPLLPRVDQTPPRHLEPLHQLSREPCVSSAAGHFLRRRPPPFLKRCSTLNLCRGGEMASFSATAEKRCSTLNLCRGSCRGRDPPIPVRPTNRDQRSSTTSSLAAPRGGTFRPGVYLNRD
ncbi:hypothetical protein QYE76_008609 [Lolium multiflorum]|uniref:Transposon protein, putative, CACTA, En/Spm sub-class n=1 Tax=Lolium multiflorum TaxID=4521 RepID=A0AAD8TRZ3_LOLMU|nr:hypothetical protein QYE76_008609 [Lolium multiflorum]